jgi:hypothetical protein
VTRHPLASGWMAGVNDNGNIQAAGTLGVMLLQGASGPADPAAARWFDHAEEGGFPIDDWLGQLGVTRPR